MSGSHHLQTIRKKELAKKEGRELLEGRILRAESDPRGSDAELLKHRAKNLGFNSTDLGKIASFLRDPVAFKKDNPQHFAQQTAKPKAARLGR